MKLLKEESGLPSYKPFHFPKAYEMWSIHEDLHWTIKETNLTDDVTDWNVKLSDRDKYLITTVLRIFTESDVLVADGYPYLARIFKPTEVKMMLTGYGARENIHMDSYSQFTDTLGFDDDFYDEYKQFSEMEGAMSYVHKARIKQFHKYLEINNFDKEKADLHFRKDLVRMMAIYSGFGEGTLLFGQFAILMNYSRQGVMNGLSTIVEWSIRDEQMHCEGVIWLLKELVKEDRRIWNDDLKSDIYGASRDIVGMADNFFDLAFKYGDVKGLTKEELKQYIRYIADRRLLEMGLKPNFGVKENPLEWMETLINSASFANFFAVKVNEYGKGTTKGDWGTVRNNMEKHRKNLGY